MYRRVGYGTLFQRWLDGHSETGYGSYSNGAAMRVSYIAYHFKTLEQVEEEAKKSAMCTHNHIEGIRRRWSRRGLSTWRCGAARRRLRNTSTRSLNTGAQAPLGLPAEGEVRRDGGGHDAARFPLLLESEDWGLHPQCVQREMRYGYGRLHRGRPCGGVLQAHGAERKGAFEAVSDPSRTTSGSSTASSTSGRCSEADKYNTPVKTGN